MFYNKKNYNFSPTALFILIKYGYLKIIGNKFYVIKVLK